MKKKKFNRESIALIKMHKVSKIVWAHYKVVNFCLKYNSITVIKNYFFKDSIHVMAKH